MINADSRVVWDRFNKEDPEGPAFCFIFPERKKTVHKRKDNLVTFAPNGSVKEFYLHSSS